MVSVSNREECLRIAEAMKDEADPNKLAELAQQLLEALDRVRAERNQAAGAA